MTRILTCIIAVTGVACGPGGSAQFRSAANGASLSYGVTDATGSFLGVIGLETGAQNFTFFSEAAGYLQITLSSRLNGDVAGLGDQTGFGVGPFVGTYDFAPPGNRVNPIASTIFVDQWGYTGNGAAPVRIAGHLDAQAGTVADTLHFELLQACVPSDALQSFYTCGGRPLIPKGAAETLTFATGALRGRAGCPDGVVSAFFGSGPGGASTYRYPHDVHFEGASKGLSCVTTKGGQAVQCGTGIEALTVGGCTWKAQALVSPHFDVGRSKHVLMMFVGATTDTPACAPVRACNSEYVAEQQ